MHIENRGDMVYHLPLKLMKKSQSLHKRTLLSVQSIHSKHNHKINKHSNNHTNTFEETYKVANKSNKGSGLATRAWVGQVLVERFML